MSHAKIANVTSETDPAAALSDYRDAIQGMNALPAESGTLVANQRTLAIILRSTGMALKEVGRYQEALSYMEQAKPISQPFLAADPNDTRAGNDLLACLENEAECFEERAKGLHGRSDRPKCERRQRPEDLLGSASSPRTSSPD